jgi:uncharacterized protein (TIGR01777 family)
MRLLLAGASGLIGKALTSSATAAGDEVTILVRRPARSAHERQWHPETGELDPAVLNGVDAVVCLSGAGVGDHRWTPSYRNTILVSRTDSVGTLATAIARSTATPRVFVTASAVGYYGDTGDHEVTEDAPSGEGFLAEVCRAWEAAAAPAASTGIRLAQLRTGLVLARKGPVLARQLPFFRLGVGGRMGSGRQYWPWITLVDEVAAIRYVIDTDELSGPINLSAPNPATNADFARTLGRVLHRPAIFPVPAPALRIALGGFAGDILASQRVVPAKLTAAGFAFRHPQLEAALRAELTG